jgi:putative ABC transport system permease protein
MMVSRQARVTYKGESQEAVNIQGITDTIPEINDVQVDSGRGITYEEVRRHAPVVFIGNDIRARFFEGVDPVGKTIAVEGTPTKWSAWPNRWAACSATRRTTS